MLSSCKNTALRHPRSELGPERSPPGAPGPPDGERKPGGASGWKPTARFGRFLV